MKKKKLAPMKKKKLTPLDTQIDAYFSAKAAVHKAFCYKPDYVEIPLDDCRGQRWMLVGGEGAGAKLVYSDEPLAARTFEDARAHLEADIASGKDTKANYPEFFGGPIYTQRFLPKWVYRTKTHVMVCYDTETDDNKFLLIFDAALECDDDAVREAYLTNGW